jgi:hypothetical protein
VTNATKTRLGLLFILALAALLTVSFLRPGGVSSGLSTPARLSQKNSSALSIQQVSQDSGTYSLVGTPSIAQATINQILCAAGSPACGTGDVLYQLGITYGIDPIYPLAFFKHESTFGRFGIAATNHGLGNIRCIGYSFCLNGYRAYHTWEQGYKDWYELLKYGYINGNVSPHCPCLTVAQIIPVYAPESDNNNETAYIRDVETSVSTWRHQSNK